MSLVRFANTLTVYYQVVQVYLTLASVGRYLVLDEESRPIEGGSIQFFRVHTSYV